MASTVQVLSYLIAFGAAGLLWYWAKRFGKVSHSWVAIDSTETSLVRTSFKDYERAHPRVRRTGATLYSGEMLSHNLLAITDRGIYGKFSLGREGKPRFVPVAEVSGVYPVNFEMPFSAPKGTSLGSLGNRGSWKALQVEAASGLVLVIDGRKHDMSAVVRALERAFGDPWKSVYHGKEMLWSNITRGDAYIHAMVRAARGGPTRPGPFDPGAALMPRTGPYGPAPQVVPGPFPLPPAFGAPPASPALPTALPAGPVAEGKGALLLEESPEERKQRGRAMLKGAALLAVLTAVSFATYPLLLSLGRTASLFSVVPMLAGFLCGVFTFVFLMAARATSPIRVFENGFEIPHYLSGRVFFFSFGELDTVKETHNFIDGDVYVLRTKQGQFIGFRRGIRGLPEVMETARLKVGRPEYVVKLPESEQPNAGSRRVEYTFYCVAMVLGFVGAVMGTVMVYGDGPLSSQLVGIGLLFPPFGMIVVTYMVYSLRRLEKFVPTRPDVRIPAVFVVGLVAYFFINLAVFSGPPSGAPEPTAILVEPTPPSSALAAATYDGADLLVNGSVVVASGERMVWVNCTVSMNLAHDREFGIFVQPGGTLILENTTLRAAHPPANYTFEIFGAAEIRNSTVSGLWGDAVNHNFDGGLEIYSDAVVIDRSNIVGGDSNVLLVRNASPFISNSTLHGGDDCIEARNTSLVVVSTRFSDCTWGLWTLEGSDVTADRCIFQGLDYGIYFEGATGTAANNSFFYNDRAGISYSEDDPAPVLVANTYGNNEERVEVRSGLPLVEICSAIVLAMGVGCLAVMAKVHREGRLKEAQKKLGVNLPPELL